MVILSGVGSAFFLALTNIYLKKLFDNASTKEIAPLNFMLIAVNMTMFAPLYLSFKYSFNVVVFLIILFTLDAIGNYFYYKAIENNKVSYASVFMSISPIITLLISSFLIEKISLKSLIAVIGIMISIYILNLEHRTTLYEPFINIFKNKNYFGLISAVFSGTTAVLIKHAFNQQHINPPTLYLFRSIIIFGVLAIALKPQFNKYDNKTFLSIWVRSLLSIASFLLYLYSISSGSVIVATAVSNIYPAFIIIFSYILFGEKISKYKGGAVISILFFIVILSYNF